jgi:hypothetical protein
MVLERLSVTNIPQEDLLVPLLSTLGKTKTLIHIALTNCSLTPRSLALLENIVVYNECTERLDLSHNQLTGMGGFWRNLNRNWLSKLTELHLESNNLTLKDLKDFTEVFEIESRPFDRLLFVLRVLNVQHNF